MTRRMTCLLAGIAIMGAAGQAAGSGAWWQLCDTCTTESDFKHIALQIAGDLTPVYVTNRDTNITRKYDRVVTTEDRGDNLIRRVEVTSADFPPAERQAFEEAVSRATALEAEFARLALSESPLALRERSSLAGDIEYGTLSPRLVSTSLLEMDRRGLAPVHESINEQAGLDPPIVWANYDGRGSIRKHPLRVKISYDDGSFVAFRLEPGGDVTEWTAADARGNEIPLKYHEGHRAIPIDGEGFAGREFAFGAEAAGHTEALAHRISLITDDSVGCISSVVGDFAVVNCEGIE